MQDLIPKWLYSHSHYHYLREAIPKRAFYGHRPSGPHLVHSVRRHNRLHAEYRLIPPETDPGVRVSNEEAERQAESLRSVRHELTDLDVDVLDILIGIWLDRQRKRNEYVEIDTDHVLHARGLKHKVNGQKSNKNAIGRGYTPQQREAVNRSICRLLLLWGEVEVIHSHDREDFTGRSRVLELDKPSSEWRNLTALLFGFDDEKKSPIEPRKRQQISYRPGGIFRDFNLSQRMYHSTSIYNYNYRHRWREKRLARYLMWQWRVGKQKRCSPLIKSTSSLVNSIALNLDRGRYNQHENKGVFEIQEKHRPDDGNPSYRTRKRLERALDRLSADNIIGFWGYREGWNSSLSRKSNWLYLWLNSQILITPTGAISKAYQDNGQEDSSISEPISPQQSLSTLLADLKNSRDLTQIELAEKVGISQSYLSSILNGNKVPPHSTEKEIRRKAAILENS